MLWTSYSLSVRLLYYLQKMVYYTQWTISYLALYYLRFCCPLFCLLNIINIIVFWRVKENVRDYRNESLFHRRMQMFRLRVMYGQRSLSYMINDYEFNQKYVIL